MASTLPVHESAGQSDLIEHLKHFLPIEDLTALGPKIPPMIESERTQLELIERALRRSRGHILLTGSKGVGKTTLVREFARRASLGLLPRCQILRIDCQNIGPEDSRACLESIFTAISQLTDKTKNPLVLCLDGIGSILRRSGGGTNKPLLRSMIGRSNIRLIGILSSWEYHDLIGGDADMLESFIRIEIEEPKDSAAIQIAEQHLVRLTREFELDADVGIARRTVALTSTFLLNACQPAKTIKILERVFEDVDFARTRVPPFRELPRDRVTIDDVTKTISEVTGIPANTIAGISDEVNFNEAIRDAVVGQEAAVQQVATELRLIKAGITEPGKPASVILFAGMTGVGKTELAKRIAELYSTSRKVQVYSMGNFTEPHSVSGIIGVPPGYVGHEQGGRLVNDLNSDPYSVFLLDEAEKCHPNIWKPFLNLFDEGWIVDQRGTKAYADRAIFILTTNAGDRSISQMAQSGKTQSEIVEKVKQTLSRIRHERSTQPVFPPQFLSRIKRIIVFNPLDEEAMIGVTERVCRRIDELWRKKREKVIEISREAIEAVGRHAHYLNEQSNGEEGGRIVRKLVSDLIESKIQTAATNDPISYRSHEVIQVTLATVNSDSNDPPELQVQFR